MKIIGSRIQSLREGRGLSQTDLANLAGVGRSTISLWESGERIPGGDALAKLIPVLETTSDYLLGLSDDPNPRANPSQVAAAERLAADPLFREFMAFWDAMDERQRWTFVEMARHLIEHRSEGGESSK